ncbi:c-type cytochrome biogenesis protein CcmI [Oceanicoccus sp. KOV_DT_Chl]|uniref:c-type cytochrome biogenesis protein CcmI n=1 Tax=Oceanicoccus sp. KOV_DT_Chl TaxID=1904639 RepID=UPI000C7DB3E2|nr:c-type cytochrome biogenesis protein CcmI [Oceanicoccus sp. KOV_DT_Chl]
MPEFFIVAIVLVLVAALFVLSPLMMNRSAQQSSREGINISVFKQRLAELEADCDNRDITEKEFLQLKTELERRLLEEVTSPGGGVTSIQRPSWKLPVMLALMLPLIGWGVYQQTGAKADWEITDTLKTLRHKAAAGEEVKAIEQQLLKQLDARLLQRPENPHYLMMIGRTQMELANYPAATDAYQRLAQVYPEDPAVLAQYAQSLYLSSNRQLTPKVQAISDKALQLNPQQPTVLGMLGIASFEAGEYQQAIGYWQQLLPMLGPVSPNRQMITAGIEQAKSLLAESGVVLDEAPAPAAEGGAIAVSLQLQVSIAEQVAVDPDSAVFVFARAVAGPRMPLAVARLRVVDLPAIVTLDDSMAMAPGLNLSSFEQVEVIARISKNGIANRGPGDWEGVFGPVQTAQQAGPISLQISEQVQ